MNKFAVKQQYADIIQPELLKGERLLWAERPNATKVFSAGDIFLIPFSLMWGGFAFFWEGTVLCSDAPIFMKLWGIPFVLVGCYIIFGRFFVKRKMKETTLYAVTDKRAVILNSWPRKSIKSIDLDSIASVNFWSESDNRGTLVFGDVVPGMKMHLDTGMDLMSRQTLPPSFNAIENAHAVFEMIEEMRQAAKIDRPAIPK